MSSRRTDEDDQLETILTEK